MSTNVNSQHDQAKPDVFDLSLIRVNLPDETAVPDTSKSPTTNSATPLHTPSSTSIMAEHNDNSYKADNKIMGGAKLSYENHEAWFEDFDYWAISANLD